MTDAPMVGGHPALDLVNTVYWRGEPHRRHDRLHDDGDVVTWAVATGVITEETRLRLETECAGPGVTVAVRELREALYVVLLDQHHDSAERETVHRAVAAAIAAARPGAELPWRWHIDHPHRADLPHLAALQAADLLTSAAVGRVRSCEDTACGWLFLDRTRNHSRRWCSSSECGNRARARRHARRTHRG